ncbi:MAG: Bax inhibitor-1/YccA family protein [Alphaproteobacteria bacterium]|nr:Bax inhibitor-1/YccA family protein [Alphaproteobacteria bacterium]
MQLNLNRTDTQSRQSAATVDQGLRSYMIRVYNYMAMGVGLTGIMAYMVANTSLINLFYSTQDGATTGLGFLVMFAPLGFIMVLSFGINRLSVVTVQGLFWAFCAVMGLSMANIFLIYTGASITRVFFVTAIAFGSLSMYGYTTKRNLSGMATFLFMGLIGIVVASLVNLFLQSSMMHFIISVVGVLVFAGLTAYDTQRIRMAYSVADGQAVATKKAVFGALSLYLNFINMFMMLLSLFGSRE